MLLGPPDEPLDLFSGWTPEVLLLELRRLERRILPISPELSAEQCLTLMEQLAIVEMFLDKMEYAILQSPVYHARQSYQASPLMDHLKASMDAQPQPKKKRA